MALLTAEDVLAKEFTKTKYREGFDQDEVDDFLDDIAKTVDALSRERDHLQAQLREAEAKLAAGGSVAPAVVEAPAQTTSLVGAATDPAASPTGMLAMAQKLHDDYVRAGEAERDRLVDEARLKAEEILAGADAEAKARADELVKEQGEIEVKIDDLRRFERDYRASIKTHLENLLGDLHHTSVEGNGSAV